MLIKFRANLGSVDAAALLTQTGVKVDMGKCITGHPDTPAGPVEIPDVAAEWLIERKIADPVETERRVRGVAKQPEVTAPAK